MRSVTFSVEQTCVVKDGWRGADRSDPAAGGGLFLHQLTHSGIAPKIEHARSARENDQIVGFLRGNAERAVGMHGDITATGYVRGCTECGDRDLATGASEQIDRRNRFNFFKSLWQNDENRGHGLKVIRMSANAPGIFRGKRLVVFGAGYVGGAVVREAVRQGLYVTALTRNPLKVSGLAADGCEVVIDELASESWHRKISGGTDFVLNCVSSGGGGVEGYHRSYIEGMQSILAWAKVSGGVGTLVYTSSTSVYPQTGGIRIDENAPTEGAGETAHILIDAENRLRGASPEAVRRWFILRLAGIYGPGRHSLLDQLRDGESEMGGRGEHRLNLIHRDDIVTAVLAAFTSSPEKTASDVFNLADNAAASKSEVVGWLAAQLGRAAPVFTGAAVAGRRAATPDRVIANDKIKAVLGWHPEYPDFRAGYRAILEA